MEFCVSRRQADSLTDDEDNDLLAHLTDVPLIGGLFAHDVKSPFADVNTLFKLDKEGVFHDMNSPLSHYFVSSGHNSYLLGNQLTSKCGPEIICKSLLRSCRVIELDCYDSDDRAEPICKHGGTLCTPTPFRGCIEAVRDNAFVSSEFPVVVTIENHCANESCESMRNILEEVLGELLHKPENGKDIEVLPCPADLKRKVLIRDKIPPEVSESMPHANSTTSEAESVTQRRGRHRLSTIVSIENVKLKLEDNDLTKATSSSRPETQLKQLSDKAEQVLKYTQTHLIRIYPAATRVSSSNFCPNEAWALGCQVGALNFQSWDVGVQVNQGFFLNNGACGYVKKPEFMLQENPIDPKTMEPSVVLTVHVMEIVNLSSSQGLQDVVMSFFATSQLSVELAIHGAPQDQQTKFTKTAGVHKLCLVDETFEFDICVPDLATLVFTLNHSNWVFSDDVIANRGVPVANLPTGSFLLPLHTHECGFENSGLKEGDRLALRLAFASQPIPSSMK